MSVHRGRAAVYFTLALLLGGLSYAVGVGSLLGQRAEASVLEAADFTFTPPAPLSLVSTPALIAVLVVIALIALWAHGIGRAIVVLLFPALAVVVSRLLKQELLVRPELFEFDAENTFPSGHMTVFAVVSAALIWAVPRAFRPLAALIGAAVMSVAAWQLLAYGWHRPSDLIGALSLCVLVFAVAALFRRRRASSSRTSLSSVMSAFNVIVGALIAIAGLALAVGGVGLVIAAGWFGSPELMLSGAQLALTGASMLTARVLLALSP